MPQLVRRPGLLAQVVEVKDAAASESRIFSGCCSASTLATRVANVLDAALCCWSCVVLFVFIPTPPNTFPSPATLPSDFVGQGSAGGGGQPWHRVVVSRRRWVVRCATHFRGQVRSCSGQPAVWRRRARTVQVRLAKSKRLKQQSAPLPPSLPHPNPRGAPSIHQQPTGRAKQLDQIGRRLARPMIRDGRTST